MDVNDDWLSTLSESPKLHELKMPGYGVWEACSEQGRLQFLNEHPVQERFGPVNLEYGVIVKRIDVPCSKWCFPAGHSISQRVS
jgi:hypothetical protein